MIRANDLRVMAENRIITYEETVTTANGDRTFLATKGPLRGADGNVIGVFGISRDITERKQGESRLVDSELRMRALIQAIPDLVWLKDKEGVYLSCNSRFEQFFGVPESEIVGKTDYDYIDKEQADFFRKNDKAAMEQGGPAATKNGSLSHRTVTANCSKQPKLQFTMHRERSLVFLGLLITSPNARQLPTRSSTLRSTIS